VSCFGIRPPLPRRLMIAYGVSFAPIGKSSSTPIFGTTGRPAESSAPSIHGVWMYGSLS
jgi:hypothetical protein